MFIRSQKPKTNKLHFITALHYPNVRMKLLDRDYAISIAAFFAIFGRKKFLDHYEIAKKDS